jgi:hypothetical protein
MNWLIRFALGFPASPADAKDVRELLPELQNHNWRPAKRRLLVWLTDDIYSSDEYVHALRRWIADVDEAQDSSSRTERCSGQECPLHLNRPRAAGGAVDDDPEFFLRNQVAAGGPNSKPPRDSFFDLVRKVHPESDRPREVILTDPYIYTDVSEDGLEGGFNNLVGYLNTLGIEKSDDFILTTSPSPKRGGKTSKQNLQRLLKKKFSNINFKDFSPTLAFHDRFYIVRHESGALRGLFGPSLNGLSSQAIVLMGELTVPQPMHKIKSWLG